MEIIHEKPQIASDNPLLITTFGFFDIKYNGLSVFLDSTSDLKWLSLLKYLIIERDKLFVPEALAEAVWPDNKYIEPKKVVRTYIHRLRKVFTSENRFGIDFSKYINILNIKGNYKLELSDNVVIDTVTLEICCKRVENMRVKHMLIDAAYEVIKIHNGEFLKDSPRDEWVVFYRNYYTQIYCRTIGRILSQLDIDEDADEVIDICEKCVKIYYLDETINAVFLRALIRQGKINYAHSHVSFILKKFESEAPMLPTEKLKAIAAELAEPVSGAPVEPETRNSLPDVTINQMVEDQIRQYLSTREPTYMLARLTIINKAKQGNYNQSESGHILAEQYQDVKSTIGMMLEKTLRKNDLYCMSDKNDAFVVLSGAKEEYSDVIKRRLSDMFFKNYSADDYQLTIDLYPLKEKY